MKFPQEEGKVDPWEINSIHFGYKNFEKYKILLEIGEHMTKGQLIMDRMNHSECSKKQQEKYFKQKSEKE